MGKSRKNSSSNKISDSIGSPSIINNNNVAATPISPNSVSPNKKHIELVSLETAQNIISSNISQRSQHEESRKIQETDGKEIHLQQKQLNVQKEIIEPQLPVPKRLTLREWILVDRRGMNWVIMSMIIGAIFGFILGATTPSKKKNNSNSLVSKLLDKNYIRTTKIFQILTFNLSIQEYIMDEYVDHALDRFGKWAARVEREIEEEDYLTNIGHQRVFAIVREAVIREPGGYVHPDLGFLTPAPCGAVRGIGMVRNSYHACQVNCFPGRVDEKRSILEKKQKLVPIKNATTYGPINSYKQEEILLIIPVAAQMTRKVALETLVPLLPKNNASTSNEPNLYELDDPALLTLLLAHERGIGRFSRWIAYIATLPQQPMCGYLEEHRQPMLEAMRAYRREYGVEIDGWAEQLSTASHNADEIAFALNQEYGKYIESPVGMSTLENIRWSLCQVASRATAGSEEYGSLRLIPIVDLINHDSNAGGLYEINGTERILHGDIVDGVVSELLVNPASKKASLAGSFVVRSLRHGRRKPLGVQQELLITYNIPHYSPLDWFVSMSFIPPERWNPWTKINSVLPRMAAHQQQQSKDDSQQKNPSSSSQTSMEEQSKLLDEALRQKIAHLDL